MDGLMEDTNRVRILHAADELFNARGYRSATIGDLAERLGMSKKTIYQYFSGKEDIAAAVVETVMERISEKFSGIESDGNPLEHLHSTLEQVKNEVVRFNPLFLEDIQRFLPDLWRRIEQFRADKLMQIERSILAAQRSGMARAVNARVATVIFLEAVQALVKPDSLSRYGFSANDVIETLIHLFIAGLAHPPASGRSV